MRYCSLLLCALACFILICAATAECKVVYVRVDGSDAADGSTWALARKTVAAGLNAALSGDEVWVANGTYVERITLRDGIGLYGGFAGTETARDGRNWTTNQTVLDGNQGGSVVTSAAGATASTKIDGFIIRNGKANYGGGIYCYSSSPTISNNTISGNTSNNKGGGISCSYSSSPIISNNIIINNNSYEGGGIYCHLSSPTIVTNTFLLNSATYGGGIYCYSGSSPIITNNTITSNIGRTEGGGIYCIGSEPTISNCLVAFNSSGLYRGSGTVTLRYNCVYGNTSYNYSGLTAGNGDISADPQIMKTASGLFHIQPTSPCRDAGDNSAAGVQTTDIDGQVRPEGNTVDIGADESYGETRNPLVMHVVANGNDTNDGLSWASAKKTVAAGINAVVPGMETWVAAGTYVENITLKAAVGLYGGFAGTETLRSQRNWALNQTIIDGNQAGSVVTSPSGAVASTIIDGFTIRNGKTTSSGGGILCSYSSPTISNNTITGNAANAGGGIYFISASPTISNNIITSNISSGGGGGICFNYSCSPMITENSITNNVATGSGGAVYAQLSQPASPTISFNIISGNSTTVRGGGLCISGSEGATRIANNTIASNSADWGGGIYCSSGSFTISNNAIVNNTSTNGGAGMNCDIASSTIINNTIANNTVTKNSGGGIYYNGGSSVTSNNTITGNTSSSGGGAIFCTSSSPSLSNNIVAFNSSGISGIIATLRYNCVYGNTSYNYASGLVAGKGDISVDPLFVDRTSGDYHLAVGSPCINAGNNAFVQSDLLDLDGEPRVMGGDVDMGADEADGTLMIPTPGFNPDEGFYTPPQSVVINCLWPDVTMHYTTNGIDPTESDPVVSGPILVDHSLTLKARAWKDGEISNVKTGVYTIGIMHVKPDGDDGSDGLMWATAKRTVQAGINAASSGVEVWVAKGIFTENIWLKIGVLLYGGFAGIENDISERLAFPRPSSDLNATILDGNQAGKVVTSPAGAKPSTIIDGFTIRNGKTTMGAGIYCSSSSPTISNNIIMNNSSTYQAGGILCISSSSPIILNNTIMGNTAGSKGGGIYCLSGCSPTISNNLIVSNTAGSGGGIYYDLLCSPVISNNTIASNAAASSGGIYCASNTSAILSNNIVAFNSSGIYQTGSTQTLRNNCVFGNASYNYSGLSAGTGDISVDPLFMDRSGGNYHIKPSSSCINAGWSAALGLTLTDMDGQNRILGGVIDIGADEYLPTGVLTSISGAKKADANSWIELTGDIVTARFGDVFYLETMNRLSGIRVEKSGHVLDRPMKAHVFGQLKTNPDGELYIEASVAEQKGSETGGVGALSVANRPLGGAMLGLQNGIDEAFGLNNIGLLVKTWGKVVGIEPVTAPALPSWIVIDDGSGVNVKCLVPAGVTIDSDWKYVSVTGISSCENIGGKLHRLLRVRAGADIMSY